MILSGSDAWARRLGRSLLPHPNEARLAWLRKERLSLRASLLLTLVLSLGLWAVIGLSIAEIVQNLI